ncbi:MAG TPA: TRAP transporter small permease [Burkholderiaceae bacterium]|nr:TRAP transporter small permease [Burkholderiaceae bacterium]
MKKLESFLANLFGTVFLMLAAIVTVETIVRKVFNVSLQGADELGGYCLAVGSAIAFSLALLGRNHIRVDVFHELFPQRLQALLNWVSIVSLAFFAGVIVFVTLKVVQESAALGSTAQTPWATPLIYPQTLWYAMLAVFFVVALGLAARATRLLFAGRIDALNRDFHPKSAKEELKEELEDFAHRNAAEPAGADAAVNAHVALQTGGK